MLLNWKTMALAAAVAVQASPAGLTLCLQDIKGNERSNLTTPSSLAYETERFGFNLNFDFKPIAIYYPATTEDAAAAVKCAAANNVTVAPRSGGHSYEGYGEGGRDGAFVIDLSLMQDFSMNKGAGVASLGAGHRLGQLYSKLWDAGEYLVPIGSCPSVGVGGHILGGGYGFASRKHGMASDNLVGVTMIDARGRVLDVSASSNPDVFWALQGAGGGSYGLVTEFRIQAYKAPPKVTTMLLFFETTNFTAIIDAYGKWGKSASEDILIELNLSNNGVDVLGTFLGSKEDAVKVLADFFALSGQPSSQTITEGTWYDAATRWAWLNNGTLADPVISDVRFSRGRSILYRKPLSVTEKGIMHKYLTSPPAGSSAAYVILGLWGGKIDRPGSPSAFDNHRGVLYSAELVVEWGDSDSKPGLECEACKEWNQNLINEMRAAYKAEYKSDTVEAYQNYIERSLENYLDAYYGSSLPRLQEIKGAIDPGNLFTFPQAIPGLPY